MALLLYVVVIELPLQDFLQQLDYQSFIPKNRGSIKGCIAYSWYGTILTLGHEGYLYYVGISRKKLTKEDTWSPPKVLHP